MKTFKKAVAIAVLIGISGCSEQSPDEMIKEAAIQVKSGDDATAIINLKNAIKLEPTNSVPRLILGKLYLKRGNLSLAEKELLSALKNGADFNEIRPLLAKSYYLRSMHIEVTELDDDQEATEDNVLDLNYLVIKALSQLKLEEAAEANALLKSISQSNLSSPYIDLAKAITQLYSDERQAITMLEDILKAHPNFTEGYYYKANYHFSKRDFEKAEQLYYAHLQLMPEYSSMRLYLADAQLKQDKHEEAKKTISALKFNDETPAYAEWLMASIYYHERDYLKSKLSAEKAMSKGLDGMSLRSIAGFSAMQLKQFEQAEKHFLRIKSEGDIPAEIARAIAINDLALNRPVDAFSTIEEISDPDVINSDLLFFTALKLIKNKQFDKALKLTNRIASKVALSPEDLIKVGLIKLDSKDRTGIEDLKRSFDQAEDKATVITPLVSSLASLNRHEEALSYAKTIFETNALLSLNLQGFVFEQQGDLEKAQGIFEDSLSLNEYNMPAIVFLTKRAIVNQELNEADSLINKALSKEPTHLEILKLNYDLGRAKNSTASAIEMFENIVKNDETASLHALQLAAIYAQENAYDKVIDLLSQDSHKTALSYRDPYWELLSDSYVMLKQFDKAEAVLADWTQQFQLNKFAWTKRIIFLEQLGQISSAYDLTVAARRLIPNDRGLNVIAANLLVKLNRYEEALTLLDNPVLETDTNPYLINLKGKAKFALNENKKANELFSRSYELVPNPQTAELVFRSLNALGNSSKAVSFLEDHLNEFPNDLIGHLYMGNAHIFSDYSKSIKHFEIVHNAGDNSIQVLNNLAWLHYKSGNLETAERYITEALNRESSVAQLYDTGASIYVSMGNITKAKELISNAVRLDSNSLEIKENYDRIMSL